MSNWKENQDDIQQKMVEEESYHWDGKLLNTPPERREWVTDQALKIAENLLPNQRVVLHVFTEQKTNTQLSYIADMGSVEAGGQSYACSKSTTPEEFESIFQKYADQLPDTMSPEMKREIIFSAHNEVLKGEED